MPLMRIDNIENLHSWAENIHQNQKDTRSNINNSLNFKISQSDTMILQSMTLEHKF
jgi:hypothetical protein